VLKTYRVIKTPALRNAAFMEPLAAQSDTQFGTSLRKYRMQLKHRARMHCVCRTEQGERWFSINAGSSWVAQFKPPMQDVLWPRIDLADDFAGCFLIFRKFPAQNV
jgi:hypothetical protein